MSYGKKHFEVLSLLWTGRRDEAPDWSQSTTVKAYDSEEAVETWAEESDQQGDYDIISSGEHGPVLVREEGSKTYETFDVLAESCPVYSARKIK